PQTDEMVCHRCDLPACVNPAHLFVGTSSDNQVDAMQKNRRPTRLSVEDVRAIRRMVLDGLSDRAIAERFSVSRQRVIKIRLHRQWRWLQ
ncbi:MAG: hypothetical protein ACHQD6_09435, partial [Steroidobacterales bacterium]